MERIDPRLLPKRKPKKEPEEKFEIRLEQLTYTIPQLAKAMPGISRQTIESLIESGDIRSIPPGGLNARYRTIPRVTLEEDLRNLVKKYS